MKVNTRIREERGDVRKLLGAAVHGYVRSTLRAGDGAPTSFLVVVNRHLPPHWLVWARRGAFNATNGCRIRRKKRRWTSKKQKNTRPSTCPSLRTSNQDTCAIAGVGRENEVEEQYGAQRACGSHWSSWTESRQGIAVHLCLHAHPLKHKNQNPPERTDAAVGFPGRGPCCRLWWGSKAQIYRTVITPNGS